MRGFTLLEMIVALAIISVLTGVAVATLRFDRKEHRLDDLSEAIVQHYRSARDEALLSGSLRRLRLERSQLAVEKRAGIGALDYVADEAMEKMPLDSRAVAIELAPQSPIYCYPNGQTSPFQMLLSLPGEDGKITRRIVGDAMGRITVSTP